jgi:translation initiation factor eIF-2B subunit epsilon
VLGLALILHPLCVCLLTWVCVLLQAGLQVLIQDKRVFACHKDRWDTIYHSELGSSLAILNAGFNIDCLMMRYQGVDWRDTASWECNARWVKCEPLV